MAPSEGSAQVLQSFDDLALRVNLDDQLQVEDQSGVKATGRLSRLTRDEIVIQTETGEKRFTHDTVREVALHSHSLREGAIRLSPHVYNTSAEIRRALDVFWGAL